MRTSPLLVFLLLLLPVQLTYAKQALTDNSIIKSPNDSRQYRAIELANQLPVLLISDPASDTSAAALDVAVGSVHDPESHQGLAHFLEHMLFLGTEKYPDADEYQRYISEHGGNHNAFTAPEHTNYFFDIQPAYFEQALDRFAEQFTSPLFNAEYVSREVNAVHSEFSSKLKDDGRRFYSAIKQLLPEGHPYRKFSVGNLETLQAEQQTALRDALLAFYEAHYSANKMRLVLLGTQTLDELEALAKRKFSAIKNRQLDKQKVIQTYFEDDLLPARIDVQSIMDRRSLSIAFPVPSAFEYKRSQPINYLANLIGHEGPGSLLSLLKHQQWADSLSAGTQFDNKFEALFTITIGLTEEGYQQQQKVIAALFTYIELLKRQGIQRRYFDEQARMLAISFEFQEKSEPIHLVSSLAMRLHDSPPEKILFEAYDLSDYAPKRYQEYLSYLTPDNMLVAISAKDIEGDKRTPWYETEYRVTKLDTEELSREISNLGTSLSGHLSLPEENIFIPENTTLLSLKNDTRPELLLEQKGFALWHASDTSFDTPKANLFLTIRSPHAMTSAYSLNATEVMIDLFNDVLNEFSYPAYLAGLNYELYNHMRGLSIKISGYNDKQSELLRKILLTIKHGKLDHSRFALAKERLQRRLANSLEKKPYEQAIAELQRTLLEPSWSIEERQRALDELDAHKLEAFRKLFFSEQDLVLLSTGNISRASSLNLATLTRNMLLKDSKAAHVARSKVVKLGGGKASQKVLNVSHPDTGFVMYQQGGGRSYEDRALNLVLSQLLSSSYYATMRTEKQLGYIVFATNFELIEVPGTAFIVQSPSADGALLYQESLAFLETELAELMSKGAQLERIKHSIVSKLKEKDNTLYKRSNYYWKEIDRLNEHFDTKEKLITAVEQVSLKGLRHYLEARLKNKGKTLIIMTRKTNADGTEAHGSPPSRDNFF